MKRKRKQSTIIMTVVIVISLIILITFTYLVTKLVKMPIDLPFMKQEVLVKSSIADVQPIIDSWTDPVVYQPQPKPEPEPEPEEEETLETKFDSLIDKDSLENYLKAHTDLTSDGYANLFIDEVTIENTSVGIKTKGGDDVLGLDNLDGVMITSAKFGELGAGKLAFIAPDNKQDIDLGIVDDLNYWEEINVSAPKMKAMFAVNASDYIWNDGYDCGNVTGLIKRNGDLVRKANNNSVTVGFDTDGKMIIGDVDSMNIGVEGTTVLIKDGMSLINTEAETTDEYREAKTAVGTTADGTIVFAVADKNSGATMSEVVTTLQNYGVTNAVMLGCGNRTVMYWNGRIVTNTDDGDGLKLPDVWMIKSSITTEQTANITPETIEETVPTEEVSEDALNVE